MVCVLTRLVVLVGSGSGECLEFLKGLRSGVRSSFVNKNDVLLWS